MKVKKLCLIHMVFRLKAGAWWGGGGGDEGKGDNGRRRDILQLIADSSVPEETVRPTTNQSINGQN